MPPLQSPLIPKAPSVPSYAGPSTSSSLLGTLGFLALLASGLGYGLLYAYNSYITKSLAQAQSTLQSSEKQFEPKLITELTTIDRQLHIASLLLNNHTQVSPLFKVIGDATSQTVQYDTFMYSAGDGKQSAEIKIKGQANSYKAIAAQSAIFAANENIAEHVFSNFLVNQNGKVEFDLRITPSPTIVYYTKWYQTLQQVDNLLPADYTLPTANTNSSVNDLLPPADPVTQTQASTTVTTPASPTAPASGASAPVAPIIGG